MSKVASLTPQPGGRERKITVVTRDNIRTLRPHPENMSRELGPPGQVGFRETILMSKGELERVKRSSNYFSQAELDRHTGELNRHRIAAAEASKERKAKMEAYDHIRTNNAKLSTLEAEAKAKSNYLLSKAQLQLEEQEDEIKHMNELMLYAKCVAIRDKQVEEKLVIKNERKEEDARLDAMMEAVRVDELRKLAERETKRIEEMRKGAATIRSQITDRREAALLEAERRDQETKAIIAQMEARNAQDLADKAAKIQVQKKLRQQVVLANQESLERKRLAKREEEEEDRKVLEYIIEKEKRETENDRIAREKKAERELELSRLRAAQEKMSDKQAQQDALRAQRAFEAHEREYRQKMLLQTERNLANEKALRESRATQQRARQHAIAVEAHKMREEFMENLERQKEQEAKIREEERQRGERNREYASKVKAQISEKEAIRRKEREEFFMEGIRLAKERSDKAKKIEQIKERKLQELASLGVPTKYCKEVERKVHVPLDRNMFSMAARH
ncbi:Cilia- and flagella-associated protein 45 [Geranomyces variabilis]|uniref:Cilia- and flagella-associated protein 45 n=1 Tax=Geranomyces variabilis TaxID=109894 RepID=A0AAD5TIB4_9FUNG|nr:Cilia- and flagella-associated protein 45 [Geranomyces variabilis]